MKIRTDFVTNSSSSSFVTYTLGSKKRFGKEEDRIKLVDFLEELIDKYDDQFMPWEYGIDTGEFSFDMLTGGLSDDYVDVDCDEEEMERREELFQEYGWDDYPPDVEVALALAFGPDGYNASPQFSCSDSLIDEDGNISKEIPTYLTEEEIRKLHELLQKVSFEEEEFIGNTD